MGLFRPASVEVHYWPDVGFIHHAVSHGFRRLTCEQKNSVYSFSFGLDKVHINYLFLIFLLFSTVDLMSSVTRLQMEFKKFISKLATWFYTEFQLHLVNIQFSKIQITNLENGKINNNSDKKQK